MADANFNGAVTPSQDIFKCAIEVQNRKRKSLSKKTRFEVFKRDSFKCQYCGASAPSVVLVVDHIEPFSKNGADDVMNFITACQPCNAGKGARKLGDNVVIEKQKAQLDDLNTRREQIEMMLEWRDALKDYAQHEIDLVISRWESFSDGWLPNASGEKFIRSWLKKSGLENVLDAMDEAVNAYLIRDENGHLPENVVNIAFGKIGSFLLLQSIPEESRRFYYIRGILRKKMSYVPYDVIQRMEWVHERGVPIDQIERKAKQCKSFDPFINAIHSLVGV